MGVTTYSNTVCRRSLDPFYMIIVKNCRLQLDILCPRSSDPHLISSNLAYKMCHTSWIYSTLTFSKVYELRIQMRVGLNRNRARIWNIKPSTPLRGFCPLLKISSGSRVGKTPVFRGKNPDPTVFFFS